jgi:hypothetical protein
MVEWAVRVVRSHRAAKGERAVLQAREEWLGVAAERLVPAEWEVLVAVPAEWEALVAVPAEWEVLVAEWFVRQGRPIAMACASIWRSIRRIVELAIPSAQ